VTVC
jgi:DNA replication protein DnaC